MGSDGVGWEEREGSLFLGNAPEAAPSRPGHFTISSAPQQPPELQSAHHIAQVVRGKLNQSHPPKDASNLPNIDMDDRQGEAGGQS